MGEPGAIIAISVYNCCWYILALTVGILSTKNFFNYDTFNQLGGDYLAGV